MNLTPILALSLLAGCAAAPRAGVPLTGNWGGVHVGLALDPAGGRLEYDCADGTIGPVVPGPGGRFIADGTHTPGHGGPIREGEVLPTYKARFDGTVRGATMTLRGSVVETGVALGPFELRRGAEPQIFRCL